MQANKSITVFEMRDLVIPILPLSTPCPVRVEIDDESVRLSVGPRIIEWSKETGEVVKSEITGSLPCECHSTRPKFDLTSALASAVPTSNHAEQQ
jgi:hypothetical protein